MESVLQRRSWRGLPLIGGIAVAIVPIATPSHLASLSLPIYRTGVAALMSAAVLAMLLTAVWLAAQARIDGSPARMLLAIGYVFTAATLVPYVFLVPRLFANVALALGASRQAAPWLYVLWHVWFLVGVAAFLAWRARHPDGAPPEAGRRWTRCFGYGALAVWLVATPSAIWWRGAPALSDGSRYLPLARGFVLPAIALLAIGIVIAHVARRRAACMIGDFSAVASIAVLVDLATSAAGRGVFTLGWYLARIDVTVMATGTLVVLVVESLVVTKRLAESARRFAREANHDSLTGLPNRRFFEREGERAIEEARHRQLPTAVGLLDIDRFKAYNDTFGHAAGDTCLQRVAALIAGCLWRPGDFVARLGGEEFVLVLPATDTIGAYFVMERIRDALADERLPAPSGRLTVSIGVAELHAGDTLADALSRADRALYDAKSAGRDRVELTDLPTFELSFVRRAG